jgi:hypothetical protein
VFSSHALITVLSDQAAPGGGLRLRSPLTQVERPIKIKAFPLSLHLDHGHRDKKWIGSNANRSDGFESRSSSPVTWATVFTKQNLLVVFQVKGMSPTRILFCVDDPEGFS